MATYYVRISGNDANTGTSPAQAWRTIQKALGSTGIASGDTVFIGAGTYRESVTVSATPTAETKIIGDVTGANTGDAGEVIWSAYTNGDFAAPSASPCLTLSSTTPYLTFDALTFVGGTNVCVYAITAAANTTFTRCTFIAAGLGSYCIHWENNYGQAWNSTISNCRFVGLIGLYLRPLNAASGGAYNLNITVSNCLFVTTRQGILVDGTSSVTANSGNGVAVTNCQFFGQNTYGVRVDRALTTTTYTTTVSNCSGYFVGAPLSAATSGQIVDNGGNRWLATSGYTNVTAHGTARSSTFPNVMPIEIGQSAVLGQPYRHPLMSYAASGTFPGGALGFGNVSGGTSTDILGAARPSGSAVYYDSGTATSGTTSTLVDTTKNWPTSYLVGWKIRIVAGLGSGQVKTIRTNSATSVTISGGAPAGGNWAVTPDATSQYVIYQGPMVETGKATSGSTTTLVDSNANWATGQWAGYSCEFDNQVATVASNTATTLTFTATVTAPTATSTYSLYFPGSSLTANLPAAGAFEGSNTGKIDTSTYLS